MRELTQHSPAGIALSAREIDVLRFIADGHSNVHIARMLSCSHHTVKNVLHDLMGRLQLRNRAHAAAYAVRAGII
ncbi:helix-turn-helix transcriptional regulator [Actinophytocola sp.]|jgi:DNA-binding NarL/FixJ family response regulator|uniref:helix-turn-helix domain-containing protein n=1 Tax=Actinophytocola sp. TaxID=1872138 RepID=UPI002D65AF70|nr:helix-turn-helix transcriptional regulator [Actinophytocola sp.]HYQ66192.1 helix-turn-helix transcriptional regulator [Actinophytocola sp.]